MSPRSKPAPPNTREELSVRHGAAGAGGDAVSVRAVRRLLTHAGRSLLPSVHLASRAAAPSSQQKDRGWPARFGSGLLLLAALAGGGCAGYRLGPTNGLAAGSRSIQVNLFENRTLEPRLSEAVAAALRKELQRDGTFELNTEGTGDILVSGVIKDYRRRPVSFGRRDILSPRDYTVVLVAEVRALERASGRTLWQRELTGSTLVRLQAEGSTLEVGADQASVERQALPLLAEDLARRIASLLVDGEW